MGHGPVPSCRAGGGNVGDAGRRPRSFSEAEHLHEPQGVALPPGRFRLRGAGSAGGHNGLKSIEGALRRQDYARLRIGVGAKPPEYDDLADWVLGRFTNDERATLDATLDQMADAVACWVHDGIEIAMTRFNKT